MWFPRPASVATGSSGQRTSTPCVRFVLAPLVYILTFRVWRPQQVEFDTSIHTFTSRPESNSKENLWILRTPIKGPFKVESMPRSYKRKESSPLKRGVYIAEGSDEDEEGEPQQDEQIVLVEGTPRVYEEDCDLIIVERVTVP